MAEDSRSFVIEVKRRWSLLILPILAALYFIAIITLNILGYDIQGVSDDMLVLIGVGFFVLVMIIELPFLMRRRAPRAPRAPRAAPVAAPVAEGAPSEYVDDECLITGELQQGLEVLEYSQPAKSRNSNAVYTKTYVPVSPAYVMRVETCVADSTEI